MKNRPAIQLDDNMYEMLVAKEEKTLVGESEVNVAIEQQHIAVVNLTREKHGG